MIKIGAHIFTAGGASKAIERAEVIGCNAMQIFGASPQQWHVKIIAKEDVEKFKIALLASRIKSVFLHAAYLPNLASPSARIRKLSVKNLSAHLEIANKLCVDGLIFHIGSGKGQERREALKFVVNGVREILKNVKGNAMLVMENAAGGGDKIGATIEEIGRLFKMINSKRVGVCIDTAHAYEAGIIEKYDAKNIAKFVKEIERHIGIQNLLALHINDSKTKFGSNSDRHENLGQGYIGLAGFKALAKNKKLHKAVWLLEVPGFDGNGPDKKNMDILKKCFK